VPYMSNMPLVFSLWFQCFFWCLSRCLSQHLIRPVCQQRTSRCLSRQEHEYHMLGDNPVPKSTGGDISQGISLKRRRNSHPDLPDRKSSIQAGDRSPWILFQAASSTRANHAAPHLTKIFSRLWTHRVNDTLSPCRVCA
jgi:hypothetical protein